MSKLLFDYPDGKYIRNPEIKLWYDDTPECLDSCELKEQFLNTPLPLKERWQDFYKKYIKQILCFHKYRNWQDIYFNKPFKKCFKCNKIVYGNS